MTSLTAPALDVDPAFDYTRLLRGEGPVWQILAERPVHLLDPKYKTWDDAILRHGRRGDRAAHRRRQEPRRSHVG